MAPFGFPPYTTIAILCALPSPSVFGSPPRFGLPLRMDALRLDRRNRLHHAYSEATEPFHQAHKLTASRRTIELAMTSSVNPPPRALSLAAAHLVLVRCDVPSLHSTVHRSGAVFRYRRLGRVVHSFRLSRPGTESNIAGLSRLRICWSLSIHISSSLSSQSGV